MFHLKYVQVWKKKTGTIIEEEIAMEENLVVRGLAFEDQITRVTILWLV